MRVSDVARRDGNLRQIQKVSEQLSKLQMQLGTGMRIAKASDDPAGTSAALGYRVNIAFETQMRRNMDNATSVLDASDAALDSATGTVQRLRELAVSASSDTLSGDERKAIASEVDQLMQQLVQVANTNFGGEYIFAGYQTKSPPYAITGSPATAVTYSGDDGVRSLQISASDAIGVNVPGPSAFGTVFDDLIAFRQALESNAPAATLQQGIGAMDRALDTVLAARSSVGAKTARLEASRYQSENTDLILQNLQAGVEQVDIAEAIVQFNAQQNALQASLGAIGRTSTMSLLDFLR